MLTEPVRNFRGKSLNTKLFNCYFTIFVKTSQMIPKMYGSLPETGRKIGVSPFLLITVSTLYSVHRYFFLPTQGIQS